MKLIEINLRPDNPVALLVCSWVYALLLLHTSVVLLGAGYELQFVDAMILGVAFTVFWLLGFHGMIARRALVLGGFVYAGLSALAVMVLFCHGDVGLVMKAGAGVLLLLLIWLSTYFLLTKLHFLAISWSSPMMTYSVLILSLNTFSNALADQDVMFAALSPTMQAVTGCAGSLYVFVLGAALLWHSPFVGVVVASGAWKGMPRQWIREEQMRVMMHSVCAGVALGILFYMTEILSTEFIIAVGLTLVAMVWRTVQSRLGFL